MGQEKIQKTKMGALKLAWGAAKSGEDYMPYLHKLNHSQLLEIEAQRDLDISHVRIVSAGPGNRICDSCKKLSGKLFNLDNEINHQTLPHINCTCTAYNESQTGFCLCFYEIVFDDEL